MEFCEAPTLESNEKDSSNEHGNFTLDISHKPCSFNATPESGTLSAPCTHEDYKHLMVILSLCLIVHLCLASFLLISCTFGLNSPAHILRLASVEFVNKSFSATTYSLDVLIFHDS